MVLLRHRAPASLRAPAGRPGPGGGNLSRTSEGILGELPVPPDCPRPVLVSVLLPRGITNHRATFRKPPPELFSILHPFVFQLLPRWAARLPAGISSCLYGGSQRTTKGIACTALAAQHLQAPCGAAPERPPATGTDQEEWLQRTTTAADGHVLSQSKQHNSKQKYTCTLVPAPPAKTRGPKGPQPPAVRPAELHLKQEE